MALQESTNIYLTEVPYNGVDVAEQQAYVTYKDKSQYDENDLPYGIGGFVNAYATYKPANGVDVSAEVWVTKHYDKLPVYDDEGNLTGYEDAYDPNDTAEASISAITEAYATYTPYNGVDVAEPQAYATYKDTSKYDANDLPYGLGAFVEAYFTYRPFSADIYGIKGLAVGGSYIGIQNIRGLNSAALGKAINDKEIYKDVDLDFE